MNTAMGESSERVGRQNNLLGYLLTENFQNKQLKKQGEANKLKSVTVLSGSQDGYLKS